MAANGKATAIGAVDDQSARISLLGLAKKIRAIQKATDVTFLAAIKVALDPRYLVDTPYGFAVRRNVNEAARGTLQTFNIAFDTCVNNSTFLGAAVPGAITPQSAFVVPAAGAGVYELNAGAYWAANLAGITLAIAVNGTAVVSSYLLGAGAPQSYEIGRAVRLAAGDTIVATVYNGSAGNITVTTFAGNAVTPPLPYLSAWRVSL